MKGLHNRKTKHISLVTLKKHSQEGAFSNLFLTIDLEFRYNKPVPSNRLRPSGIAIFLAAFMLLNTACSPKATMPDTPTPTPLLFITATLPPTQTPVPSPTLAPPTATEVVTPAEGQTTAQLNVRSAPSAEGDLLGSLPIGTKIQIVGKNPAGTWWLIAYPDSPNGTGWVTAQYVQATNTENVPVISNSNQPQPSGDAPSPGAAPVAETSPSPGAGGAGDPPVAPTLSLASAFADGDSAQAPAVSIILSKASVRSFNYSSDVSAPDGDPEDWVQFTIDGQAGQGMTVSVRLDCTGSGALSVELIQNNSRLQGWQDITCGHSNQLILNLYVGAPYDLRISQTQANNIQKYISYTVIVTLE